MTAEAQQSDKRDALAAMRIWLVFAALTRRGAARYTVPAAAILAGELERAAVQYLQGGEVAAVAAVHTEEWVKYLDRVWVSMVPAGGQLIGNWLGEPDAAIFEPAARAWLNANGAERVAGIAETSESVVSAQIRTGVDAGETAAGIAERLRRARLEVVPARAHMIAGTEVHAATNYGSYVAAVDSRAVQLKVWLATPDGRTRDAHVGANGQRRELNDVFQVGGEAMMYPGDPAGSLANTINCRCVLGYAVIERRPAAGGMTFGSLFAGIGGLDLGLERAGMECRWQVEIEPYAIKVLRKHWPGVRRYGDITKLSGADLERVDVICGGFPCQDLSQAGKQAGIEGTRSGLWFEYARLVRELGPRYVLIENVAGLLIFDAMRRVIGELARLGYVGCWRSLRASEFGASHLRKRVFIVAYRDGAGAKRISGIFDGERTSRGHDADGRDPHVAHGTTSRRSGRQDAGTDSGDEREDGRGRIESERIGGILADAESPVGRRNGAIGRTVERNAIARASGGIDGTSRSWFCDYYSVCHEPNECDGNDCWLKRNGREYPAGFERTAEYEDYVADAECTGLEIRNGERGQHARQTAESLAPGLPPFAPGPSDPRWPAILAERPDLAPALESAIRGMADGFSGSVDGDIRRAMNDRTKRLARLGNAVVPQIAEWAGRRIMAFDAEREI